jgi:prolipoprotein diacylglyceryltransferase
VPVQLIKVLFHTTAAAVLAVAAWRGWASSRRQAIYLTCCAILRFALETWRGNPPVALGLTWCQFLAIALGLLAGGTWWHLVAPSTQRPRRNVAVSVVAIDYCDCIISPMDAVRRA